MTTDQTLLTLYFGLWSLLALYGVHRAWLTAGYLRRRPAPAPPPCPADPPRVLVQLPIFNERYVAARLIRAVAALDYPGARLEIQVLDDSTDDTPALLTPLIERLQASGVRIRHLRRPNREGYKAGALGWGLAQSDAELVAIFDADFIPRSDFLQCTVGRFADPALGLVQSRWDHLNRDYSLLTRVQAVLLDGHFVVEQTARHRLGCFFNFNGTAGLWRRAAIDQAGGWHHDTLTEDLDLSYRAQMLGWRFLYLEGLTTPAEVPVEIHGYQSQQHRWTKGAMQCARKLLPALWRSGVPLRCRVEGTLHLLSNVRFLLVLGMGLLLGPLLWAHARLDWGALLRVTGPLLALTTGTVLAFYWQAGRPSGLPAWQRLALIPAAMALTLGMSLANGWAVLEGLARDGGEFVRTPKFGIRTRADGWNGKRYAEIRHRWVPLLELAATAYFGALAAYCVDAELWLALPFVGLFLSGFGGVAALSWRGVVCQWLGLGCGRKTLADSSAPADPAG